MRVKKGSQIVIGTPSYVEEMIRHGDLKANSIRVFFLDRADEVFSGWGICFIEGVIRFIPRGAQVIFSLRKAFKELKSLTDTFMRSPVLITRDSEKPEVKWYQRMEPSLQRRSTPLISYPILSFNEWSK